MSVLGQKIPAMRLTFKRAKRIGTTLLAVALLDRGASALVCSLYRLLGDSSRAKLHRHLAKAFVGHSGPDARATSWDLEFERREISMPLRGSELAVDWDNLLSVLGAELEVKSFYRRQLALARDQRPEVFVDCGASYGTHSLLWATHDVPVVAFEPNPECHRTFDLVTRAVRERVELYRFALGARTGVATLSFPDSETWIGSIAASAGSSGRRGWCEIAVEVRALDEFRASINPGRALMKIDVEASEVAVLRGARLFIEGRRPTILVETLDSEVVRRFLDGLDYGLEPLSGGYHPTPINFVALPRS
jgi:FkbM family methyltransferase